MNSVRKSLSLRKSPTYKVSKHYNCEFCPFGQKLRLALALKGMDVPVEWINLNVPRTEEYLAINPTGQVPTLEVTNKDGKVLFIPESAVTAEFLDEAFPKTRKLRNEDPYKAAIERVLVDRSGSIVGAMYVLLSNHKPETHDALVGKLEAGLKTLNKSLLQYSPDGEYLWDDFGWFEVNFAPFFVRITATLKFYYNYEIPKTEEYERLHKWIEKVLDHQAVKDTTGPGNFDTEYIIRSYYTIYKFGFDKEKSFAFHKENDVYTMPLEELKPSNEKPNKSSTSSRGSRSSRSSKTKTSSEPESPKA